MSPGADDGQVGNELSKVDLVGAHQSEVVLRAHYSPVFSAGAETESSENIILAHGGELDVHRRSILQDGVAGHKGPKVQPSQ